MRSESVEWVKLSFNTRMCVNDGIESFCELPPGNGFIVVGLYVVFVPGYRYILIFEGRFRVFNVNLATIGLKSLFFFVILAFYIYISISIVIIDRSSCAP